MQVTVFFTRHALMAATTAALFLSACGDGGSSALTASQIQGRWVSTGLTPAYTAILEPAAAGASSQTVDTFWALSQDASTLVKLRANGTVQPSGTFSGHVYTLGSNNVTTVSSASYSIQTAGNSQNINIQPLLGTTALFDRTDAMGTALTAAQANGQWQADLGTARVNWSVASAAAGTNNLSGTSTTGCTYSGQSTVVATQALYKVQFIETCSGGTTPVIQIFAGIGTLNADNTRLTVVATNEADSRAAALLFVKLP